ncbi:autotransporter outer membrane beta-barrel domain-containing protein [Stappia sp. ICDLI1TA098]
MLATTALAGGWLIAPGGARAADVSINSNETVNGLTGGTLGDPLVADVLLVGESAVGTLLIEQGGTVESSSAGIGQLPAGKGAVTITGDGSTFSSTGDLSIGKSGAGSLTISDSGVVTAGGATVIARDAGSSGTLNIGAAEGDTAVAAGTLNVDTVTFGAGVGTIVFNHTDTDRVFAADMVAGAGSSRIRHLSGTTTLTGTSGVSGAVTVTGGTLAIASSGTLTSGSGNIDGPTGAEATLKLSGANAGWTISGALNVGLAASGTLLVETGAKVENASGTLGLMSGSHGTATVTGPGAHWKNNGDLSVGYSGTGTMTVSDGGLVENKTGVIGTFATDVSTVTVTGASSLWSNDGDLFVGQGGSGALSVEEGGKVANTEGFLGYAVGSSGTATVSGNGSTWSNTGGLIVGNRGRGDLKVLAGGKVESGYGTIGFEKDSIGEVTVSGAGSLWKNNSILWVGRSGNGTLTVADGGAVELSYGYIGEGTGAVGVATITGPGSTLRSAGALRVGSLGKGTLIVANGGAVENTNGTIGYSAGAEGSVTVTGVGSSWTNAINLKIGNGGKGELTVANGGVVNVTGAVTIAQQAGSAGVLNIGSASGATATAAGVLNVDSIAFGDGAGQIVFNHTGTAFGFSSDVTGTGVILQEAGVTRLTGDYSGFLGTVAVSGGTLAVDSVFDAAISVLSGGTLAGNGTLSNVTLASGARVSPGNSIGTLNIAGDLGFVAGTSYAVEVTGGGAVAGVNNDIVRATGHVTIDVGASVTVGPENGTDTGVTYSPATRYTILTADAGRVGMFGGVSDSFAFLDAELSYDANNVYMTLSRNDIDIADVGQTRNQIATGTAIQSTGIGSSVYDTILGLSLEQVRSAFDQMSGEVHASVQTTLARDSVFVRGAVNARIRAAFDGVATSGQPQIATHGGMDGIVGEHGGARVWGEAFGAWGRNDGDGNAATLERTTGGFFVGADMQTAFGWQAGIVAGYGRTASSVDGRASSADVDSYSAGVYAGQQFGPLGLRLGGVYTWHDVDTRRDVAFGAFTDRLSADYSAATAQVFAEIGYRIERDLVRLEPFAGLALVHQSSDGFAETGGAAALTAGSTSQGIGVSTFGLRGEVDLASVVGAPASFTGSLGWRHAFGRVDTTTPMAMTGSVPFSIAGAPIDRDTLALEAGVRVALGAGARVDVSYRGELGASASDQGVTARLSLPF